MTLIFASLKQGYDYDLFQIASDLTDRIISQKWKLFAYSEGCFNDYQISLITRYNVHVSVNKKFKVITGKIVCMKMKP